jgi:hypothetical protein
MVSKMVLYNFQQMGTKWIVYKRFNPNYIKWKWPSREKSVFALRSRSNVTQSEYYISHFETDKTTKKKRKI